MEIYEDINGDLRRFTEICGALQRSREIYRDSQRFTEIHRGPERFTEIYGDFVPKNHLRKCYTVYSCSRCKQGIH